MADKKHYDLVKDILPELDPSDLDYQEWLTVGMGMKADGYAFEDWDAWSRRDMGRYPGTEELRKKWDSFRSSGVTGGSIVSMLWNQKGFKQVDTPAIVKMLDWDDIIEKEAERVLPAPEEWNPVEQIKRYIKALFQPGDFVLWNTKSKYIEEKDKYTPTDIGQGTTYEAVLYDLDHYDQDLTSTIGTYDIKAGVWIHINPMDGHGASRENVTAYRYALVECDTRTMTEQLEAYKRLRLPTRMVVNSGGKSVHAIVHIDAKDEAEYNERVKFLFDVCAKQGLPIDEANKNPNRLSRLPGVQRGENRQYIIDECIGEKDYATWYEWITNEMDELPPLTPIESIDFDHLPELPEPLIDNVLRRGQKMIISGASKTSKSFALIQLALAIASGGDWMGFHCKRGHVCYVNLEIESTSFLYRVNDIMRAKGISKESVAGNLDIWQMRGHGQTLDKLEKSLIKRLKHNFTVFIIDPIYKVITGDENSASEMSNFVGIFDRICRETGAAAVYAHHFTKGASGGKASIDRASGSGVFARDPDAILTLTELNYTQQQHKEDAAEAKKTALMFGKSEEDANKAYKACMVRTPLRLIGTLREFAPFEPVSMWFEYPIHRIDHALDNLKEYGNEDKKYIQDRKAEEAAAVQKVNDDGLVSAVTNCNFGEPPSVKQVVNYMGRGENTIRRWVDASDRVKLMDGKIYLVDR